MNTTDTYRVPRARQVKIGDVYLGSNHPVVIQSMANTNTLDVEASILQLKMIVDAGASMVRFTTQGIREVKALEKIILNLENEYRQVPVVADVHFNAKVALAAARICEKVRINPGNFTEKTGDYTDASGQDRREGLEKNRIRLKELIDICKSANTALRIGVNHGSLSGRIMSVYGDTPEGMVESAMEFARICGDENFDQVVISLKSSNSVLMVQAVRMLTRRMVEEDLYFPLHLGVTESGDGMEGRVKSVAGIAPLLAEGIGDTIRVSLTEPPENEIPVAAMITAIFPKPDSLPYHPFEQLPWDPFHHNTSIPGVFGPIGGTHPPVVISGFENYSDPVPDFIAENNRDGYVLSPIDGGTKIGVDSHSSPVRLVTLDRSPEEIMIDERVAVVVLDAGNASATQVRYWFARYLEKGNKKPVILKKRYDDPDEETMLVRATGEFSLLLTDSLLAGVWLSHPGLSPKFLNRLSFMILQATRNRIFSTEYIACPSCGRTRFDIQSVLGEVRQRTSHLKGLKIAVMGCIVNGPGEMADADYGYIGAAEGKVTIYAGKKPVAKNVPQDQAVNKLIEVISEHGDWKAP